MKAAGKSLVTYVFLTDFIRFCGLVNGRITERSLTRWAGAAGPGTLRLGLTALSVSTGWASCGNGIKQFTANIDDFC